MKRCGPLLLLLVLAVTGCSDHGDPVAPAGSAGPPPVSYAGAIQPIWNTHCIGCHGAGGNGGLDLRDPGSRGRLVDVDAAGYAGKRVAGGEPDLSVLYRKMIGAGGVGESMPPAGVLDPTDLETVRRWIVEGAPDN